MGWGENPPSVVVCGGRVIDPSRGLDAIGDLLLAQGLVLGFRLEAGEWAQEIRDQARAAMTVKAASLVVCPGFVDLHSHLREPGFEQKETIASGTKAAAKGGFTTICCMPNTQPTIDNQSIVDYILRTAGIQGSVRVLPIGCITKGQKGEELAEMGELAAAGVVGFSDDGRTVASSRLLRQALEYAKIFDLPIMEHCEDASLAKGGVMHEGWVSTKLGLKGIPAAAEEVIVARDIALAELTGGRLHIAHASTAGTVDLVRRAKEKGLAVTAEVTPHHLTLTHERVMGEMLGRIRQREGLRSATYDTSTKVNPPLRTAADVKALVEGLIDGTIDAIATDHAPHAVVDKLCEYDFAAFGISGFETALGALLDLVHAGELELTQLIRKLTVNPASVLSRRYGAIVDSSTGTGIALATGLGTLQIGAPADLVIFDPNEEWVVEAQSFVSKGRNTPYDGCVLKGRVKATFVGGHLVYQG